MTGTQDEPDDDQNVLASVAERDGDEGKDGHAPHGGGWGIGEVKRRW